HPGLVKHLSRGYFFFDVFLADFFAGFFLAATECHPQSSLLVVHDFNRDSRTRLRLDQKYFRKISRSATCAFPCASAHSVDFGREKLINAVMKSTPLHHARGFTLIELLVVIAIIAIL